MEDIQKTISRAEVKGLMDYIKLAGVVDRELALAKTPAANRIRIAVLSSFNLSGIREVLLVECVKEGIYPEIYVGEYNQYNQEILDANSGLYDFSPDLLILVTDTRTVAGESFFRPYSLSDVERKEWVKTVTSDLVGLVRKAEEGMKGRVLIHNFEVPTQSTLGILENRQEYGYVKAIQDLNSALAEIFRTDPRVFVLDYELFASKVGKDRIIDYKMYYLGDIRINPQVMPQLCLEYMRYVRPLLSRSKKCLVLDLDNVLWGGVVGEDGVEGISLGPTPEGRPFMELQKLVLSLYERGVILAVNSANNLEDVLEVFRKHPHMVLKEDNFAAMKINWENKVTNMREIAEELELGVDSFVFLDDGEVNRDMMRSELPEVLTVDLPRDPALYPKTLMNLDAFDTLRLTNEDLRRGEMYAEQRKRQEYRKTVSDIGEYLRSLGTVVTIEKANRFSIPRIAQLSQKTNQFNTTTRRYLEDDVSRMAASDTYDVFSVTVNDKFGDSGLTGVAIVEKSPDRWRVDSFLLSCRVLGRKVEDTVLAHIVGLAKKEGAKVLVGEFIPTKKNVPASGFYQSHGFSQVGKRDGVEVWERSLESAYEVPQYVKLVVR